MTRMWGINPKLMCDQHLLGEHSEMHQEVGTLRNHAHGRKVVEGHAEENQIDTSLIQERHDDLVEELERRGFEHDSPMDYRDKLDLGEINIEKNIKELAERCEECRERMTDSNVI